MKTKKMILTYKGRDDWDRPVYENNGRLYVDIDPRASRKEEICTKYNNEFYGEPDVPISKDIEIEFIPQRDIW
jgi:hypothetical protein